MIVSMISKSNDRGATAVEYGLMVALITIVVIGAVSLLGTQIAAILDSVSAVLTP